jgi:hypothetical protein
MFVFGLPKEPASMATKAADLIKVTRPLRMTCPPAQAIAQSFSLAKTVEVFFKGCRNEDLAITDCKSESRKTSCHGILLCLLDHFYTLTIVLFYIKNS